MYRSVFFSLFILLFSFTCQVELYEDFSRSQAAQGVEDSLGDRAGKADKTRGTHVFQVRRERYIDLCTYLKLFFCFNFHFKDILVRI